MASGNETASVGLSVLVILIKQCHRSDHSLMASIRAAPQTRQPAHHYRDCPARSSLSAHPGQRRAAALCRTCAQVWPSSHLTLHGLRRYAWPIQMAMGQRMGRFGRCTMLGASSSCLSTALFVAGARRPMLCMEPRHDTCFYIGHHRPLLTR